MNDHSKKWDVERPSLVGVIVADCETGNVLEDVNNWSEVCIEDLTETEIDQITEISHSIYDRLFNSLTQVWVTPETEGKLLLSESLVRPK